MNLKQKGVAAKKRREKNLGLRHQYWPDIDEALLWDRTINTGFATIPRTLPIIFQVMDNVSGKGKPLSNVYFPLWCRVNDQAFLEIESPQELAAEAGFSGSRAVSVWNTRMKKLAELGFILPHSGTLGVYHHVLLYNPYTVIKNLHASGSVLQSQYDWLFSRASRIGADDLIGDEK